MKVKLKRELHVIIMDSCYKKNWLNSTTKPEKEWI